VELKKISQELGLGFIEALGEIRAKLPDIAVQ
jgi:hypothetical protein